MTPKWNIADAHSTRRRPYLIVPIEWLRIISSAPRRDGADLVPYPSHGGQASRSMRRPQLYAGTGPVPQVRRTGQHEVTGFSLPPFQHRPAVVFSRNRTRVRPEL